MQGSLGTGEYCDIPYQFLVGYDGSLWEGRPYDYISGATASNNDGNIAVCFLGCYDPSGCSTAHAVTDAMMGGGQLLVQTLAELHTVARDADAIRGHRDWPDNATACPGESLYARLDELRQPLGPAYAATLLTQTCAPETDGVLSVTQGETGRCTIEFTNSGSATWTPGATKLAPIPRDEASPLAAATWLSGTRIATVESATVPGGTGRFVFDVGSAGAGDYTLALGIVEEWTAWFADDGGPEDGAVRVQVRVAAPEVTDSGGADSDSDSARGAIEDSAAERDPGRPGDLVGLSAVGACACAHTPFPAAAGGMLGALAWVRRRRVRG